MTFTSIRAAFADTRVLLARAASLVAAALVKSTETAVGVAVADSRSLDRGTCSQKLAQSGGRGAEREGSSIEKKKRGKTDGGEVEVSPLQVPGYWQRRRRSWRRL